MHPITDPKQIGGALAARRKSLELTQRQVADRLGLSQNRLSELESKPETMTVEQLLALLNALGLAMTIDRRPDAARAKVEW